MGGDARTVMWLGVSVKDEDDLEKLLEDVPEYMYDQLRSEDKVSVENVFLSVIKFPDSGDPIGFGMELINRGWRDGTMEFDIDAMAQLVRTRTPWLEAVFKRTNIDAKVKVCLASIPSVT